MFNSKYFQVILALFLSAFISLTSCKKNDSNPTDGNETKIIETASKDITAAKGGTITLPSGSSVSIPAGTLTTDQQVTISLLSSLPKQPPSGHPDNYPVTI